VPYLDVTGILFDYTMELERRQIIKGLKSTKKCDDFCKRYTKTNHEAYQNCRRIYCNKPCKGALLFGSPKEQALFKKQIKHGFHKNHSRKRVMELKKKGALSACSAIHLI